MGGADKLGLCCIVSFFVMVVPIFAASASVKYLPGFDGPLPFELETGYIGVGELEDVQLFYYFVKSMRNQVEDPLLLWMTGGPRCSGLSSLFYEIGPLRFVAQKYNGTLPSVYFEPASWNQVASIIYVDAPVGTGFSYSKSSQYRTGDFIASKRLYEFLIKWMNEHPEFLKNSFYSGGESYIGKFGPLFVKEISDANEAGSEVFINLKGYILGNPITDADFDDNKRVPFAHGMALISDELYESLKIYCEDNYIDIDSSNVECLECMQKFNKCLKGIDKSQILGKLCPYELYEVPEPEDVSGYRRCLGQNYTKSLQPQPPIPDVSCRTYKYYLAPFWADDERVHKALNIRKGTVYKWQRCRFNLPYTYQIQSSVPYHSYLSKKGYPSLIYSGDHDMIVPFLGTEAWIKSLNYSLIDEWRSWFADSQVAGYTKTYSNRMTYATVKGAGHTAPEYKPKECLAMFARWVSGEPL